MLYINLVTGKWELFQKLEKCSWNVSLVRGAISCCSHEHFLTYVYSSTVLTCVVHCTQPDAKPQISWSHYTNLKKFWMRPEVCFLLGANSLSFSLCTVQARSGSFF